MYNKWISNTSNNEEFMFANLAMKNMEFALISIEHILNVQIDYKVYQDDYTYFFYYLQNLMTACGSIADIFNNNNICMASKNAVKSPKQRSQHLRAIFGIDMREFPLVFTKEARNTNTHSDERYEEHNFNIGDYNIIDEYTPEDMKRAIINKPHLRTYDKENRIYITRGKSGNTIRLPLEQLRQELVAMKNRIESNEAYRMAWERHK